MSSEKCKNLSLCIQHNLIHRFFRPLAGSVVGATFVAIEKDSPEGMFAHLQMLAEVGMTTELQKEVDQLYQGMVDHITKMLDSDETSTQWEILTIFGLIKIHNFIGGTIIFEAQNI